MKDYMVKDIRNIAVLGHGSEGKTTLVESMLYAAGVTDRQGRVEDGNTVSDYDPEEIKRQVTVSSSIAPFAWGSTKTFPVTSILRAKCPARCTPWRARSSS